MLGISIKCRILLLHFQYLNLQDLNAYFVFETPGQRAKNTFNSSFAKCSHLRHRNLRCSYSSAFSFPVDNIFTVNEDDQCNDIFALLYDAFSFPPDVLRFFCRNASG